MSIKKYMDGSRYMPEDVFQLLPPNPNRRSIRLQSLTNNHSLVLATNDTQKNSREDKLSAAHMRVLWNLLDEETVRARPAQYREKISRDELYQTICIKLPHTVLNV
jgi:hypothetical protein